MKRKRNGFTLVELLGVIVILSILVSITTPFVLDALDSGKNSSYEIMVDNIITASKMYYEECKYGDIYDKNGNKITCGNQVNLTLQTLVEIGHLPGVSSEDCSSGTCITKTIIKNPKTDTDISSCQIKIIVLKDSTTGKVTYVIDSLTNSGNMDCPISDYNYSYSGNTDGKVLGVTN